MCNRIDYCDFQLPRDSRQLAMGARPVIDGKAVSIEEFGKVARKQE